jgi:hypothetical protein
MRPRYLHHLTLSTGHVARTLRADVSAEALAACRALIDAALAEGIQPVPGVDGYLLEAAYHGGRCLVVHVRAAPSTLLVSVGIAAHSRCGAALWRAITTSPGAPPGAERRQCPPEPWCTVQLMPGMGTPEGLAAAPWLGDLERCLAWAWIDRCAEPR